MPIAEVGAERQLDRFVSSKQLVEDLADGCASLPD